MKRSPFHRNFSKGDQLLLIIDVNSLFGKLFKDGLILHQIEVGADTQQRLKKYLITDAVMLNYSDNNRI